METPRFDASCKAKAPFMYDDPYDDDPLLKITSQPDGSKNIDYYLINEIEDIEDYIDFLRALNECHPSDTVDIHINCFGGAMYAGYHIFDALCDCPATINMHIDGFCCSAASTIMMAGDNFDFAPHSCVMVHSMSTMFYGKWHECTARLEFDKSWFEETAREIYAGFMTDQEIQAMIDGKDFWFTAREAHERIQNARREDHEKQALVAALAEKHQAEINEEIKAIMEGKSTAAKKSTKKAAKKPVKKVEKKTPSKKAEKTADENK
ncbi:MAG: ATP-dependent Clp protease proteolytic subunit [Campylobacter sp.]|nr:ATP-dependent Clp protease proteolytic subunit [Campylobacter sp.]